MKKLKNILRCNYVTIVLILMTSLYCSWMCLSQQNITPPNQKEFLGIIETIEIDENKIQLQIKGEHRVLANYYFTSKEESLSKIDIGYQVKVVGDIKIPSKNSNFNLFNYRNYLLSKSVLYTMTVDKVEVLSFKQNVFYRFKSVIKKRIEESERSDYLKAFLLGDTSTINEIISQSYAINGISHLFSVSGMHVGFISSIFMFILAKFIKNKTINQIILFIVLFLYVFLAGFSPSILRSVIFIVILFFKEKWNLPYSTFKLFIIMTCCFLLYNPYYIYHTGFLYSFVISGFLIYFSYLLKGKKYFHQLFSVSFISFLASFPISLLVNFELNFFSLILNLVFVPFVSFIIFPLSFLVFICPYFTVIYDGCITILEWFSLWCSKNFSLVLTFEKTNICLSIIYYGIIIIILKNVRKKAGYFLLVSILCLHYHSSFFLFYPRLSIIDVGQGDSILIELPYNKGNVLIDTGGISGSTYSLATSVVIPYLKSVGIKHLDNLVISHGDYDHMGEAINLVNNFKVEKVIFNCGEFNELEQELIKVLDKKKILYYSCIKELNIDNNKLYFLNNKDYGNENDNSSVIYTQLNNHKFLFMGDAGVEVEEDLIEKYNLKNIDVLKIGHHGSKTSSSKSFIDKINPKYGVISVGKNNRYGHPNKEVLSNLEESKIFRTDQDGSIMFKIKNNKLDVETCTP